MITDVQAIKRIDRAFDAFLEQQLARDAALLRKHGATTREVRDFCRSQRDAYQVEKHRHLAEMVAWVMNVPTTEQPRIQ